MMKRLFALCLASVMLLGTLTGCGKKETADTGIIDATEETTPKLLLCAM